MRIDAWLPRHRRHSRLIERQLRRCAVLVLSHKVADDSGAYHDYPADRIRVVYNGVDVVRFAPDRRDEFRAAIRRQLGLAEETVLALAVAHNFVLKGVPTILEALRRLALERLPLHLAVVGGWKVKGWQRWANARGLGNCVSFLGLRSAMRCRITWRPISWRIRVTTTVAAWCC